ncbi:kinetochore protein nuf2 [Eremomyces bilateralis CBS 781.70]|uniref:Probable kinetochore protein NUF2 n=1 Tax=Eremomyces bilateralis CBS 781.70 TaxID=1392243 RepID=A0A6G1GFX3_9PEZI|nr:kinetochore protein nuf2 [Eremomyces bilateralis CBS 781.70]KAF1816811.1 kinetochore protein nuf2 [Eremomyces bilateralis CBS 781.70]
MDFNPRMSTVRGSTNHKQSHKQQEEDAFMNLPDKEIASCISDIGLNFTLADLQKPNPQQIQKVFEWFAELLMNTTRDVVAPAMRAAADDIAGQNADGVFTSDTRDLMGFFVQLRRLLQECQINDFTFNDLYKPTYPRLVKIFSYIINFIRFRESHTETIDAHFNKSERTKLRIEQLYSDNAAAEAHLISLQRHREATDASLREKEKRSNELKQRLLDLKKGQERVSEQLGLIRAEQSRLKNLLEQKTESAMALRQEATKLRPYTTQSPAALETSLRELNATLAGDKASVEALDRRARALQTSANSFTQVTTSVVDTSRLLSEVSADLAKEDEEGMKATRHREALSERSNNVREVEKQEQLLRKQLASWQARTEKLRRQAEERGERARERMEVLRGEHEELKREKRERGQEVERRRVRIEQVEKKMADLKENIENEVNHARDEYMKMESHIRLYVTEMEQSIN